MDFLVNSGVLTLFFVFCLAVAQIVLFVYWYQWVHKTKVAAESIAGVVARLEFALQSHLGVIKQIEKNTAPEIQGTEDAPDDSSRPYRKELIPKNNSFYYDRSGVGSFLVNKGVITESHLDHAREEHAKRGGHLVDHLFALGYVTEEQVRKV